MSLSVETVDVVMVIVVLVPVDEIFLQADDPHMAG